MTKKRSTTSETPELVREPFVAILAHDVILALERQESNDTQASRRDLIRTMFVAIEGLVWFYGEHVGGVVKDIATLPALTELALSETSYAVTENGKIVPQTRFIKLTAKIRLISRLAEEHCPALQVDFTQAGWSRLQQAIKIRNRITHPKVSSDLKIETRDIDISWAGFVWLLSFIRTVMESTTAALRQYTIDLTALVDRLSSRDPLALAEYETAKAYLYSDQN